MLLRQHGFALGEAVRDSADVLQSARAVAHQAEEPVLDRYARFEDVADVASAALRRIRPNPENLYRSLDELLTRGSPAPTGTGL